MVERIRKLLESRQLTPTQFADAIGIARPIVSHILSGRNKPSLEVVQRILAAMPELSMPWLLNGTGPMEAESVPNAAPVPQQPATPSVQSVSDAPPVLAASQLPQKEDLEPIGGPTIRNVAPTASAIRSKRSTNTAAEMPPSAIGNRPAPRRFAATAPKAVAMHKVVSEEAIPAPITPVPEPVVPPSKEPAVNQSVAVAESEATASASPNTNPTAAALFAGTDKPIRRIVIFYRDGSFADYQPE